MKKILSLFVKYPFYGKIVIALMLLVGGFATYTMKKSSFPITESHTISISVAYQGATPKEMDEGVTSLIEDAIRGTVGVKEFSSTSSENSASVTVTVFNDYDVDDVLPDVKNAVDGISNFPTGAEKPVVSKKRTTTIAMFVTLRSKSNDIFALKTAAQRVEDDFLASGKLSQVSISGYPARMEVSIEVNEDMLRRYDMSISEIQNAVASNNLDIYAGEIKNSRERIDINSRYRSVDPKEIEQIVVRANSNGSLVRVKDVAEVVYQFEDSPAMAFLNGERSFTIRVDKLASEDLEEIDNYVHNYIDNYNAKDGDIQLRVMRSFLDILVGQLDILYSNGGMGVLLVILSLSIFLSFRLSLWVAWGIPSSFLGMFIIANLCGVTINIISCFGMILIVGILVDDGIVIGENIFSHFEMGKTPRRAAIDGTLEVMPAVFTSVTTTMIAFLPLFYIQGSLEMFYELGFVVVFCLAFSLLEGMFVLPSHLASESVLKPLNKDSFYGKIRNAVDKFVYILRDRMYMSLIRIILRNKLITYGAVVALFVITGGLISGGRIQFSFFPSSSEDMFMIDLALKPGVNEETTNQRLAEIEAKIVELNYELGEEFGEEPPIENMLRKTGSSFSGSESGTNTGDIRVFLRSLNRSKMNSGDIKVRINEKVGLVPDAYKFAVGASDRFGAPVSIGLLGHNRDELEKAAEDVKAELAKFSSLYNILDNNQVGGQEVRLKLNPLAYSLGLTQNELMSQVRQAFYGGLAQRIQNGKDEVYFYVRYSDANRRSIGDLEKMMIRTSAGSYPLDQLADYTIDRGVTKINHFNGKTEIRIEAYMRNRLESSIPIIEKVEKEIIPEITSKYNDVTYMAQGQKKDTGEEMGKMQMSFGIAFLLIIIIIMIFFRSLVQGIMICSMVLFGVLAAIWGHGLEGLPLSLISLFGIVALSGTIINDAVVFLSRYNQNLTRGFTVNDSIFEAAKSRFRPIMLTTITTTLGLFPLIKETSSEADIIKPMAVSLGYGILFGTFFILTVLPLFIVTFNKLMQMWARFMDKIKGQLNRDHVPAVITAESVEVAVRDKAIDEKLKVAMAADIVDDRDTTDVEL